MTEASRVESEDHGEMGRCLCIYMSWNFKDTATMENFRRSRECIGMGMTRRLLESALQVRSFVVVVAASTLQSMTKTKTKAETFLFFPSSIAC